MRGAIVEIAVLAGEYARIRNQLQFGMYFAPSAGGYAADPPQMNMQQFLDPESMSARYGVNAPRRGCGSIPFIALQRHRIGVRILRSLRPYTPSTARI